MILFKTSWEGLFSKAYSSQVLLKEFSSPPTEQALHRTPWMSLSPVTELITYWFKTSLQKVLVNCFKEILTEDFGGDIVKNIFQWKLFKL